MISFLQGKLQDFDGDEIVLNVGGVGYQLIIPSNLADSLPALGDDLEVFTHFHLREDAVSLYGFLNKEELSLFELLLSVSGIGPRVALNIIGAVDKNQLIQSILAEEVNFLTKLPGIGKKTAQRLVLELRDKVAALYQHKVIRSSLKSPSQDLVFKDAFEALNNLGYSSQEITSVLVKGQENLNSNLSTEALIRFALKEIAKTRR